MKTIVNLFALVILLLNTSSVYSQDYIKFPEEGAVWTIEYNCSADPLCHTQYSNLSYLEDSIINGIKQSKIGDYFVVDTNKLVYTTNLNDFFDYEDSVVLYNYNLNVNDTFTLYHISYDTLDFVVYEIDSLLINDKYRIRIKLDALLPETELLDSLIWIEGIGSNYGPIYPFNLPFHEEGGFLYCYKLNNEKLFGKCTTVDVQYNYSSLEGVSVHPNPVNNVSYLVNPFMELTKLKIYNSKGQLIINEIMPENYYIIAEKFTKGIYFYILTDEKTLKYTGKFIVQ